MKRGILALSFIMAACGSGGKDGAPGPAGQNAGAIKELLVCEEALVNISGPWQGGYGWYERARMEGGDVHVSFKLRDGAGAYYSMSVMYKAGMEGGKAGHISLATPHGLAIAYGPTEPEEGDEPSAFVITEGGPFMNVDACKLY